jgi:hypothetical protein
MSLLLGYHLTIPQYINPVYAVFDMQSSEEQQ